MLDILDYHKIIEKYRSNNIVELPSLIDQNLLGDNVVDTVSKNMESFIKDKTKQVQINTSKRVIKQFHKNIEIIDK